MKFTIPYDTNLSKNKKVGGTNRYTKRIFQSDDYADAKHRVYLACRKQYLFYENNIKFKPKTKTKLTMMFYRPNYRADIQNFLEAICDAIKIAIDVGDNYYIFELDYEIDKINPRIEIEIIQD